MEKDIYINNDIDDDNDDYDEKETTYKRKPQLKKSEISFSSVLSTSSCGGPQKYESIKTLYPPPSSIKSDDLPSRYESNCDAFESAHHNFQLNNTDQTSKEVVFREFSRMLITLGDNLSSDSESFTKSSKESSTPFYMSKRSETKQSTYGILSTQKILDGTVADIPKVKKQKLKLHESIGQEVEVLKSLEECIRLPITGKELIRISFSENLMISYDKTFNDKNKSDTSINPNRKTTKYPKIRNLMPSQSDLVGAISININSYDNLHILTFCSSQQCLNGSGGSSKIMSTLDQNFKLVEEKKTEAQMFPDKKMEKILHVVKENDRFIAFRTELNEKNEGIQHRGEVTLPSGDMLLDGGSYAVMRYLILKKFSGQLKFWSMDIQGNMCKSVYDIGKTRIIHINNIPYKTYRIKYTLLRQGRMNDIAKSYYLPNGFLIRHEWKNCPYFLHINPLSKIPPKIYPNLEDDCLNDCILISKYLDEKDKRVSEIKTYMGDHPEIKNILKDYILCLLYSQPENILNYTIEYFLNLFKE